MLFYHLNPSKKKKRKEKHKTNSSPHPHLSSPLNKQTYIRIQRFRCVNIFIISLMLLFRLPTSPKRIIIITIIITSYTVTLITSSILLFFQFGFGGSQCRSVVNGRARCIATDLERRKSRMDSERNRAQAIKPVLVTARSSPSSACQRPAVRVCDCCCCCC